MKKEKLFKQKLQSLESFVESTDFAGLINVNKKFFREFIQDKEDYISALCRSILSSISNKVLFPLSVRDALCNISQQKLMDSLYVAFISYAIADCLEEDDNSSFTSEDLFRLTCLSCYFGYEKGESLFRSKLRESEFYKKTEQARTVIQKDYLELVFGIVKAIENGEVVAEEMGQRYEPLLKANDNTVDLDPLCELRFSIAKEHSSEDDFYYPFDHLADSLFPYEILTIKKILENQGVKTVFENYRFLIEPWLEFDFEKGVIKNELADSMIKELNNRFKTDFYELAFE